MVQGYPQKIVEVTVDGFPSGSAPVLSAPVTKVTDATATVVTPTRIWVELRMSTGLHISQKNLTYQTLRHMIENGEGVEMAATYHSVISTVKMQGKSACEFLGKFFTNIFNGCRDYSSLSPQNIGLALCQ